MSKDALPQLSHKTDALPAKAPLAIESHDDSTTLYNYLADDLDNIFQRGDKLRFSKFGTQSAYLPSFATAMQFLGWKNPSLTLFSFIEAHTGVPLKVSRTARYDLFGQKGVAERAGVEVFNWLTITAESFFKLSRPNLLLDIDRAVRAGSNAGDWLSGIEGYTAQARLNDSDNYFELEPLLGYLELRCREDVIFLESAKSKINQQQIDTSSPDISWQLQQPLWQESSLVDETILNGLASHFKTVALKEAYSSTQKLSFLRCYLPVYFDFYFGAFASFEVGCILYYRDDNESLESKKGILNLAITSYSENPKVKSCFEALLIEIRDAIPYQGRKMTWTDLASFIPVNVDESELETSATTLKRKKVDRLKVWRNKKDLPNNGLLRKFLCNLHEYFGEQDNTVLGDLCLIAMGIDRQVIQLSKMAEREGISKREIESEIRSVLTTYDKYYQHSLNQYL